MTNKEAINIIKELEQMECNCSECERRRPALEYAMKAIALFELMGVENVEVLCKKGTTLMLLSNCEDKGAGSNG